MAPVHNRSPPTGGYEVEEIDVVGLEDDDQPSANNTSKTYQYRKVTKPMLERKRRARINGYLEDLKSLLVDAFAAEGESITKLEKADILELTVKHLRKVSQLRPRGGHHHRRSSSPEALESSFRSGYSTCVDEVSRFLALPGCLPDSTAQAAFSSGLVNSLRNRLPGSAVGYASRVPQPWHQVPTAVPHPQPPQDQPPRVNGPYERIPSPTMTAEAHLCPAGVERPKAHSPAFSDPGYNSDGCASPPVRRTLPSSQPIRQVWRPF